MTPPRDDATMAYVHHLAKAIHLAEHTPNHPDQMRIDCLRARRMLDLFSTAGLEVRFSSTALEGSARRG